MRLAQFQNKSGFAIGLWQKNRWLNFSLGMKIYGELVEGHDERPVGTIQQLLCEAKFDLQRWKKVESFIQMHSLSQRLGIAKDAVLRAPVLRPPKIIALGRNYVLHAKEANLSVPEEPIIFAKAGSCVVGPTDVITIPREYGRIDHEAELALVIGRTATRVKRSEAFGYVAGYTVAQDITARDLQNADLAMTNPWFRSKSFDTFMPMGPWLVLRDEIRPPVHLKLECRVNGHIRQKASTRDMVFDIPTVIEFITRHITLEPGDVISTGTPEGISEIKGGDEIVTRIEKVGEMRNRVRFESR